MSKINREERQIKTKELREKMQKVPIVRKLFHNTLLKIISLLFAIALWSVVMAQSNPMRIKVIYDVPVEISELDTLNSRGLSMATSQDELPDTVNVRLEVPMNDLSRISANNVRASIDLSRVTSVGEHEVSLTLSTLYGSALSASISEVDITVENLTTSIIPVQVETSGQMPANTKLGSIIATPAQFQITGPETTVNRIAAAVATIDLAEMTKDFNRSIVYTFVDDKNNPVESVNINSSIGNSVSVSVPVYPVKEVPIEYQSSIVGELKDGYLLEGIEIAPTVVRIAAEQEVLDELDALSIATIDLKNLDKSFTATLPLKKSADIYWTDVNEVDVIVRIKEEEVTKTFTAVPVQYRNLAAGHKVDLYSAAVDVEVTMAKSQLEKLSNEDIWVYVDLAGLGQMPDSTAELYVYLDTDALTYETQLSTEKIIIRIDKVS